MDISIISIVSMFAIIAILIIIGIIETNSHLISLSKIPIRVHVNGARGKSSVVRLIAAGLREGGMKTFAKTTGTIPRIINENGNDVELHRLRSASIGEQIKLMRYFGKQNPNVLVVECMAVNPQYQWISEHRIIRSTLSVITNVRKDHVDEMGVSNKEIAYSLSNTIPYNSKVITAEKTMTSPFEEVACNRNSILEISNEKQINSSYLKKFPYIEHPENIGLALKVCEELGVPTKIALNGMAKTKPDPGALFIWNLKKKNEFVSAFAANDPDSTLKTWELVKERLKNTKVCFFLNTRDDRRYRTIQLIDLILGKINPDMLLIRADKVDNLINKYKSSTRVKLLSMEADQNIVVDEIMNIENYSIVGVGNIVGWGDMFLEKLKEYKV